MRNEKGQFIKGITPWNKGKKGLQVGWNKGKTGLQVAWNKGIPLTEECKQKLRLVNLGKYHSEESKRKISITLKGHKGYWLGKHFSEGMKKKISESNSGEKGNNWKGGVTPINEKIRKSPKYNNWRIAVFQRDNHTCQLCGSKKSGTFNAHHKKSFSKYLELRFDVNNGITLCKDCHENNGLHNRVLIA